MKERTTAKDEPQRTCIGCRTAGAQAGMVRCTMGPQGPSVERSAPGRGAWVCSMECFDTAVRRRSFARAWKQAVEEDDLDRLRIAFQAVITMMRESPAGGCRPAEPVATKG
jgi:uncharacterized protein